MAANETAIAKSETGRGGPQWAVRTLQKLGNGAADRTRTYDPIITNDVLYHLSYSGPTKAFARLRGA